MEARTVALESAWETLAAEGGLEALLRRAGLF